LAMDIQHITGRISPDAATSPTAPVREKTDGLNRPSFEQVLKQVREPAELQFSKHAVKRLENRSISVTNEDISRIEDAVKKAEEKGGRESLVLDGNRAFLINIKNKTVITALDMMEMREHVFTNIDSTVFTNKFST